MSDEEVRTRLLAEAENDAHMVKVPRVLLERCNDLLCYAP